MLALPSKIAGNTLAAASIVLWCVNATAGRVCTNAVNPLSWLLGLLGLIYLGVSFLEMRRSSLNRPEVLPWRYVSYGSILLIEAWFSLRLAMGSVEQLQFYVIPLGLIVLIFGWQERNGSNPRLAPMLEGLGLLLLLGPTLLQAFGMQTLGFDKIWYGLGLLIEGLLIVGFGAVERWRYYFFGGVAAIILDLMALLLDPVQIADKWLVLGLTGLTLVGLALFLERKRDTVVLLSKSWLGQFRQWE